MISTGGKDKRVSVVGLGYIGLPTAAVFASRGFNVIGVDVNEETVETINQGRIHIVEPDLDMLVQAATHEGFLRATTKPEPAEAFLIAVPTPFKDDHEPDLSFIEGASRAVAKVLKPGDLVVLESTSPVGATEQMAEWMSEERPDLTFPQQEGEESEIRIAHCPERVLPGHVLRELVENDRVIGGMTPKCSAAAVTLYKSFVMGECVVTDARTAEMCKLTENAFRDVNIAFANELSLISDKIGISVWELIRLANRHPRVNILQPGPGVGGHCIAVDPWFIVNRTPDEARLMHTARQVNDGKPNWVVEKVRAEACAVAAEKDCEGREVTIAAFGLAFKADIDDLRESPAVAIVERLSQIHDGKILAVEPNIDELPVRLAATGTQLTDPKDALERADIAVLLVDHGEFRYLRKASARPGLRIVDCKGIWSDERRDTER